MSETIQQGDLYWPRHPDGEIARLHGVDAYVDPEDPALATATVIAVRLWLMAVSEDQEQGYLNDTNYVLANQDHGRFDDGRRRVVAMKTIQLRNARTVL